MHVGCLRWGGGGGGEGGVDKASNGLLHNLDPIQTCIG